MGTVDEIVHEGWLVKSPPPKSLFHAKWRRRWFVLRRLADFPARYRLEYFTDSNKKKVKGFIDLDECEQVEARLTYRKHHHIFSIRTAKRMYYLSAGNEDVMAKWVQWLCQSCGLKEFTPTPPPRTSRDSEHIYANASPSPSPAIPPLSASTLITNLGSPSPLAGSGAGTPSTPPTAPLPTPPPITAPPSQTPSSASLYIPISECTSGKRPWHPASLGESGKAVAEVRPPVALASTSACIPGGIGTQSSATTSWSTYPRTNTPKDHSGGGIVGGATGAVYANASPDVPLPPKSHSARRAPSSGGTVFTFEPTPTPPPVNRNLKPHRSPALSGVAGAARTLSTRSGTRARGEEEKVLPPPVNRSLNPFRKLSHPTPTPEAPPPIQLDSPPRRRPVVAHPGGTLPGFLARHLQQPPLSASNTSLSAKLKSNQFLLSQQSLTQGAVTPSTPQTKNGDEEEEIFHYIINGQCIPASVQERSLKPVLSDVEYTCLEFPHPAPSVTDGRNWLNNNNPPSVKPAERPSVPPGGTAPDSSRTEYKSIDPIRTMGIRKTRLDLIAREEGKDIMLNSST